ncbi:ferredoxin [Bradyrhizobium sp. USDA 241]
MRNAPPFGPRARTTEEAAMSERLRVHVDPEKCQGHARCKALAPELFELDEYGNAHEAGDGAVPPGLEDKPGLRKPTARKSQSM